MWAVVIIVVHPLGREQPDLVEVVPVVLRQPFVAHGAIGAFDVSVLLRLTRLNAGKLDSAAICPCLDQAADVLATVIAANGGGTSAPLQDLFLRPDDSRLR